MNFFAHQAAARARARRLIWLFIAAVIAVVVSVDAIVMVVFSMLAGNHSEVSGSFQDSMAAPSLWIWTGLVVLGVVLLGTAYRTSQLNAGGGSVAQQLGADRVQHDTRDPVRRRLWNVVEEMSIASGVPIPAIYVLENEPGINAFAAGHSTTDAAITVTRGALDRLNRDELQGVIGHEFSHILNGDMRVNIRLMGLLFGLVVIGYIGQFVMRGSARGEGKKGGVLVLGGLAVMILGYVGIFLGRMIQAAVSRQCEAVADASSVQFTRDTQGLRNALVKIGALDEGSRLQSQGAEEVAHMLFASGFDRVFATHPPLIERIRVLDPSFNEREFAEVGAKMQTQQLTSDAADSERNESDASALAGAQGPARFAVAAGGIAQMVGQPSTEHVELARRIRESLPQDIIAKLDDVARAVGVLWCLLLDADPAVRKLQLEALEKDFGARHAEIAASQYERISQLHAMLRLPLLMRLVPALRRLSGADRVRILAGINRLVRVDGKVTVYEYALSKLVQQGLAVATTNALSTRELKLSDVTADLQVLFSVVAEQGSDDALAARQAYELGMSQLLPRERPEYGAIVDWVGALDAALARLSQLVPAGKEALVEALVKTIALDNQLTLAEAELLRAICAIIQCPLPPLGPGLPSLAT
jgi:Zn-dependent protease with chaperone function